MFRDHGGLGFRVEGQVTNGLRAPLPTVNVQDSFFHEIDT